MKLSHYTNEQKMAILEHTFFPVVKVKDANSKLGYSLYNANNERKICEVSEGYALISNREAVKPFIDTYGIEKLEEITQKGYSFFYSFNFGKTIDLSGNGDFVRLGGIVQNSYDKTSQFRFVQSVFRLVCSNGLFTPVSSGINYNKKHYGNIPLNSLIKSALEYAENWDFTLWQDLAKKHIDRSKKIELVNKFKAYEVDEEKEYISNRAIKNRSIRKNAIRYIDYNNGKPSSPENFWGLYNDLNTGIAGEFYTAKQLSERIKLNTRLNDWIKTEVLN